MISSGHSVASRKISVYIRTQTYTFCREAQSKPPQEKNLTGETAEETQSMNKLSAILRELRVSALKNQNQLLNAEACLPNRQGRQAQRASIENNVEE